MSQCQRCRRESFGLIMSMFNTTMICGDCKDAEKKRPDYKQAEARNLLEYASKLDGLGMSAQADNVREVSRKLEEEP